MKQNSEYLLGYHSFASVVLSARACGMSTNKTVELEPLDSYFRDIDADFIGLKKVHFCCTVEFESLGVFSRLKTIIMFTMPRMYSFNPLGNCPLSSNGLAVL